MKLSRLFAYSIFVGPILFTIGSVFFVYTLELLPALIFLLAGLAWFGAALLCWIPILSEMD